MTSNGYINKYCRQQLHPFLFKNANFLGNYFSISFSSFNKLLHLKKYLLTSSLSVVLFDSLRALLAEESDQVFDLYFTAAVTASLCRSVLAVTDCHWQFIIQWLVSDCCCLSLSCDRVYCQTISTLCISLMTLLSVP